MNTLIGDLVVIINNHLTIVEDFLFLKPIDFPKELITSEINEQFYMSISKNKWLAGAVKEENWPWILYYVQRHQYCTSILSSLYCAACRFGNKKLMKLFYSYYKGGTDWKIYSIGDLAVGRQYDLLDQHLIDIGSVKITRLQHTIAEGLVINNELEIIKSGKYGSINLNDHLDLIIKYKHTELRKTFNEVGGNSYSNALAKIQVGELNYQELFDMLRFNTTWFLLFKHGHYDFIDEIADKFYSQEFTDGLITSEHLHLLDKYINNGIVDTDFIVDPAIEIDNVELFKKYFVNTPDNYADAIRLAVDYSACGVLKYLLELDSNACIDFRTEFGCKLEDPRIAQMLIDEAKRGRKILGLDTTKKQDFDAAAKIIDFYLSNEYINH